MLNFVRPGIIALLILLSACRTQINPLIHRERVFITIDSLIEQKDFFAARIQYEGFKANLSDQNKLLAEIFLYNAFNKPDISNEKIETLLRLNFPLISDSISLKIKTVELDNSIKLYNYNRAREITENLIGNFSHLLDEKKLKDHQNTLIIWTALKDQLPQKIYIKEKTELFITKDRVGLQTLPIHRDNIHEQFVFDTGANFSTITESAAELFGLNILEGKFEVNSITGIKIESRIGVAPTLFLGEIEIKNAVFLVFPDEALGFPQIDYQINGIIGFPVIEALKEIQITRDGRFLVPLTPTPSKVRNLAIDFLTPLLFVKDSRGSGTYTFDTGAGKTMLYNTYYEKYLNSSKDSIVHVDYTFGGAGGNTTKKGTYIPFNAVIGNSKVVIDSVMVLREELHSDNKYLGNIGQDLIGKFEKMTINFEEMFIRFD